MLPIDKVRDDGKWLLRNAVDHILEDSSYQVQHTFSAGTRALPGSFKWQGPFPILILSLTS